MMDPRHIGRCSQRARRIPKEVFERLLLLYFGLTDCIVHADVIEYGNKDYALRRTSSRGI